MRTQLTLGLANSPNQGEKGNDPKDYNISNQFYAELIQFWAEFRNAFSDKDNKSSIIWNNKNIRIDGDLYFTKTFLKKTYR